MSKKTVLIIYIFITSLHVSAQSLFEDTVFNAGTDSVGTFSFFFRNSNFVKDNEYFNSMVEGYTLIGYWIEPSVAYKISENSDIEIGASLVRFSGKNKWWKTEPTLSFRHYFSSNFKLTLGSLHYQNNFYMPAPLFNPERYYLSRIDNGARIDYKNHFFNSITWLSWDKFIFYGDTVQEQITAGSSNRLSLIQNQHFKLQLPVYFVITHLGGQINRPKKPIETLINIGSGLNFILIFNDMFVQSLSVNPQFFYYKQLTSVPLQPFKNGYALYPQIAIKFKNQLQMELDWWYNHKFIAPRGEPIYGLISSVTPDYITITRNIGIIKVGYNKAYKNNVTLQCGIEGYYFPSEHLFDYNFLIHLNWQFKAKLFRLRFSE